MISDFERYRLAVLNLHAEAGKPTLATVAAKAGVCTGTVHRMLKGGDDLLLPSLDNLLRMVEALSGDETEFRRLWEAADRERAKLPRRIAQRQLAVSE